MRISADWTENGRGVKKNNIYSNISDDNVSETGQNVTVAARKTTSDTPVELVHRDYSDTNLATMTLKRSMFCETENRIRPSDSDYSSES